MQKLTRYYKTIQIIKKTVEKITINNWERNHWYWITKKEQGHPCAPTKYLMFSWLATFPLRSSPGHQALLGPQQYSHATCRGCSGCCRSLPPPPLCWGRYCRGCPWYCATPCWCRVDNRRGGGWRSIGGELCTRTPPHPSLLWPCLCWCSLEGPGE